MMKISVNNSPHDRVMDCVKALAEAPDGAPIGFRLGVVDDAMMSESICVEINGESFPLIGPEINIAAFVAMCFSSTHPDRISPSTAREFAKAIDTTIKEAIRERGRAH